MSVINATPLLAAAGGDYQISRSVRTRSSASAQFRRVPGSSGNAQKFTFSLWKKLGSAGGYLAAGNLDTISALFSEMELSTAGNIILRSGTLGVSYAWTLTSVQVFRDPAAWYHIVIAYDTTQATNTDRCKVWVNNQLLTFTGTYPAQNYSTAFNTTAPQYLCTADGYTAELHWIDAQQLTPSSFGETDAATGVWKPKKYLGTYGSVGSYLKFDDTSSFGKDSSGNSNTWTASNISNTAGATYDSMLDTPTPYADGGNGRGNYAVLNSIAATITTTYSNGNLRFTSSNTNWTRCVGSIAINSGKWYWEVTANNTQQQMHGIQTVDTAVYRSAFDSWIGRESTGYSYFSDGNKWTNNSGVIYGSSYGSGDVIGIAFDATNGELTFYKNGVSQGLAFSSLSGTFIPAFSLTTLSGTNTADVNFGQRPFAYTPPTGFKALNTQNLPESTIKKGNAYFDAKLYTGNGSTQTISGLPLTPDFVWIKRRSGTVQSNQLYDTTRGVQKVLYSDLTNAETTDVNGITAFTSDGFSVGSSGGLNNNGDTHVAWTWRKGASAGFDIVTYTSGVGTVAHSLGVAPSMIIIKPRNNTDQWTVGHKSLNGGVNPWNYGIPLNTTAATQTNSGFWNNTAPTSSVFSTGSWNSGFNMVAYLFAEVAGFSKFGSYTGNGSADGPFVYCGFRPRYVMFKDASTATTDWKVLDTARDPYNTSINTLAANTSTAETAFGAGYSLDILSNGFKVRGAGSPLNTSSATIIYAAFAENPFKNSLAR